MARMAVLEALEALALLLLGLLTASATSGSPTPDHCGAYKIYTFTGSGSITF